MFTLHIQNEIASFSAWTNAFDRYDKARRDHGVLAYRITQPVDDEHLVYIELDFATREDATGFVALLERIWQTPLSQGVSATHTAPELREVRVQQQLVVA
ncbi:hypothetical protein [Tenggerimyces flavus]|uniref:Antibiotic biosynthesis monooxygenase n=1 Tax=Tenggerimyces flavus TaxID=1708749 RepID=A0ABV7YLS9_9ACTN|nr:hypothetical protein [Tenggerimyces flavus]MBM7787228.1 hypothetical protein [Tenggerimyces flavus]